MAKYVKYIVAACVTLWASQLSSAFALSFNPYPTGTLVNDSGTIYFISGSSKEPFTNWQAFAGLGYNLQNVVAGDLTNYPLVQGYTINTPNAAHPWGSWLINQGTVYYSTQGGLIGVPSSSVFTSNGGDWQYIVRANQYDVAALNANPNLPVLVLNDPRVGSSGYTGGNPNQGILQVTPGALAFTAVVGGVTPAVQSFYVNPGSSTATWSAQVQLPPGSSSGSYNIPGLSLIYGGASSQAIIYGTGPASIGVSIVGPFTAGSFNTSVLVTSNASAGGQSQFVNVSLGVTPGVTVPLAPSILNITPTTVAIGGQMVVSGSGFAATNTVDVDSQAAVLSVPSSNSGQTLSFTVPSNFSPQSCGSFVCTPLQIQAGPHVLSVYSNGVLSNSVRFTITGTSSAIQVVPSAVSFTANVGNIAPSSQQVAVSPGSSTATWTAQVQSGQIPGLNLTYGSSVGAIVNGTGYGNVGLSIVGPFTAGGFTSSVLFTSGGQTQTVSVTLFVIGATTTTPTITSVTPTSAPVGTTVYISGSGFAATNTVDIDTQPAVLSVPSSNGGQTLSFTLPSVFQPQVCGAFVCTPLQVQTGSHVLSVYSNGVLSNSVTFTVTSGSGTGGTTSSSTVAISASATGSSSAGRTLTITATSGTSFTPTGNQVYVDGLYFATAAPQSSGQTISFPIPSSTQAGSHSVVVVNANGTSNTATFSVAI